MTSRRTDAYARGHAAGVARSASAEHSAAYAQGHADGMAGRAMRARKQSGRSSPNANAKAMDKLRNQGGKPVYLLLSQDAVSALERGAAATGSRRAAIEKALQTCYKEG
jgi:hypothetical protein